MNSMKNATTCSSMAAVTDHSEAEKHFHNGNHTNHTQYTHNQCNTAKEAIKNENKVIKNEKRKQTQAHHSH